MGQIHINSFKSVQIEILAVETKAHLSWATGFICIFENKYFLITNWHVVSGKNFETKNTLHDSGAVPGFFKLFYNIGQDKKDSTLKTASCLIPNIPLYDIIYENDSAIFGTEPLWFEHPIFKSDIDVAVIEISEFIENDDNTTTIGYNIDKEILENVDLSVMDDVFIIGYPLKSSTTPNYFPIHKSATIVSEPNVYKSLPMFYVDGKTKSGMSGSPVVKRSKLKVILDGNDIVFNEGKVNLVGIYSGRDRQTKSEYEAELGIVWRFKECVLPILNAALEADMPNNSKISSLRKILKIATKS